jgi:peptide/nickel transport system substrate-binding protein
MNIKKLMKLCLIFSFLTLSANELKVIGPNEIKGLEPTKSGYIFSRLQIAENLVKVNDKGEILPNLAISWETSADELTWKFKIRPNVKFQDDTVLDAQTVVLNLTREDTKEKSILRYLPIEKIDSNNDELIIKLTSKVSILPAYLAHYTTLILSKNSFENGKVVKFIGTGPFKITNITEPLLIKADRFDSWWGKTNEIEKLTYNAVGTNETRVLMIKSGDADIAFSILPISLKSLEKNPNLDIQTVKIFRTRKLKLNSADEILKDKNIRHAISYAINRDAIAKGILKDESLAATQMFPPELVAWHNKNIEPLTFNIKKSEELLKNSGWEKQKDGFLYKDGKKLELELITYPNWPELPIIATVVQNQLKQVGIDLKISVTNSSEVVRKHKDNSLQLALISKNFTLVPNPLGTISEDYGENGGDWGAMNWKNEKMASDLKSLYEKANLETQFEVSKILNEELPSIPLTWSSITVVSNKKIKNLKIDPFEISYNLTDIKFDK